jgi:hypothetical protein
MANYIKPPPPLNPKINRNQLTQNSVIITANQEKYIKLYALCIYIPSRNKYEVPRFPNLKFKRCNCLHKTSPTKASSLTLFYTTDVSLAHLQTSLRSASSCRHTSLFYWRFLLLSSLLSRYVSCGVIFSLLLSPSSLCFLCT